ncbi:unnamed protein product [Durusdinium trenchii]|uniref:Uncharacterized protein n=1 Tax=Durusdinium trenchii TaxID=1381693 RepID=A0ABP0LT15_9DINO
MERGGEPIPAPSHVHLGEAHDLRLLPTRYCRYKDEEMLKPGVSSGFMASSAAVLATNVPTLVAECSGSIASLTCINQMAEASSVMGFIGRAISKAKELTKEGKIKECKKVLPDSLASSLGDSVAQYIGFLHQLGGIDATLLEEKQVGEIYSDEAGEGGCAEVLQRKTFAQICEAPLTDADAKLAQSLSEEDLKKVVEKAIEKNLQSAEKTAALMSLQEDSSGLDACSHFLPDHGRALRFGHLPPERRD